MFRKLATGGTTVIVSFTAGRGTWLCPTGVTKVDYLVVAGGDNGAVEGNLRLHDVGVAPREWVDRWSDSIRYWKDGRARRCDMGAVTPPHDVTRDHGLIGALRCLTHEQSG